MIQDFFSFRRMLTPLIIQTVFWVALAACMIAGVVTMFLPDGGVLRGLETLIFGPLIVRILCELVILFFRMNETLTDIHSTLTTSRNSSEEVK